MEKDSRREAFPLRLFAVYVLFYSGQSIYNTYLNLYLSEVGLKESQIGLVVSVSTGCLLAAQLFWGMVSDRTRTKNRVLHLLYVATAVISMGFYLSRSYWFLLVAVILFTVFFNPIMPLMDNFALEYLETSRWDYGQVRMGGTMGYCLTVLFIGFFLQDDYAPIFWMVALCMAGCRLLCIGLPKISGYHAKGRKAPYRALLQNRALIGLILFNLTFSIGTNFYYNFYSIYYTSDAVGGNSSMVGVMMFASAVSEIPMLLLIHRIIGRLGIRGTLTLAGGATVVRWLLLAVLHQPVPIIFVNLLHGLGYTSFSYCIVTYIARTVPRELRATGQTLNALIGNVVSKVLFGFVGGFASQYLGADRIMLFSAVLMAAGTIAFVLWSRNISEFSEATPPRQAR